MSETNVTDLYMALLRLNRQMMRYAHLNMARGRGLHHGQARLLEFIAGQDGASQRDLAEEMDVRPSSMTEMLGRLEQAGWIKREQDENDQRVMRVYLTEAGKKIVEETTESRSKTAQSFFEGLTDEEKAQLAAIAGKLSTNLEARESKLREAFKEEARGRCGHRHMGPHGGLERPPFGHGHHWRHPFFDR